MPLPTTSPARPFSKGDIVTYLGSLAEFRGERFEVAYVFENRLTLVPVRASLRESGLVLRHARKESVSAIDPIRTIVR